LVAERRASSTSHPSSWQKISYSSRSAIHRSSRSAPPSANPQLGRGDRLSGTHRFFTWYNDEHRHSGIGFHTPADVHYGRAEQVRAERAVVLEAAYAAHPERFVRKPPAPPKLPTAAWINQPTEEAVSTTNP
jgi:hypothetical protein